MQSLNFFIRSVSSRMSVLMLAISDEQRFLTASLQQRICFTRMHFMYIQRGDTLLSTIVSAVYHPTRHFGAESFQAIDHTDADNQKTKYYTKKLASILRNN